MVDTPTYAFKMANAKLFFVGSWWPFGKAWRCMCFKQKENCKTTRNFRFFKFRPLYPSTPAQSSQMTILSLQAWLLLLCMPHSLGILPSHCLLVLKFVSFKLLSPDHITTPNLASSLQLKVISISFLHSSTNLKAWWFKALFCYYFKFALYYKRYGTS